MKWVYPVVKLTTFIIQTFHPREVNMCPLDLIKAALLDLSPDLGVQLLVVSALFSATTFPHSITIPVTGSYMHGMQQGVMLSPTIFTSQLTTLINVGVHIW